MDVNGWKSANCLTWLHFRKGKRKRETGKEAGGAGKWQCRCGRQSLLPTTASWYGGVWCKWRIRRGSKEGASCACQGSTELETGIVPQRALIESIEKQASKHRPPIALLSRFVPHLSRQAHHHSGCWWSPKWAIARRPLSCTIFRQLAISRATCCHWPSSYFLSFETLCFWAQHTISPSN